MHTIHSERPAAKRDNDEPSAHDDALSGRIWPTLASLAAFGVAGQVLFAFAAMLLPFAVGYSFVEETISALANSRLGAIQTAAFFLSGTGTLALAYGLRATTRGAWGSRPGAAFVALLGGGAIVVGLFPTDLAGQARTIVGTIHVATAILAFISITAGMLILSRTFRQVARWRSFWRWSAGLAVIAALGLLAQAPGRWPGLTERLFIGTTTLWQILVGLRLYRDGRGARPADGPPA